eukprot:403336560
MKTHLKTKPHLITQTESNFKANMSLSIKKESRVIKPRKVSHFIDIWPNRHEIQEMNMVMLNDKLRAFKTEGFNYKDRKISKAGKIWVKESDKSTVQDYEQEERKLFLRAQIRNGILCKDIKMLMQAIENAHKYPLIHEQIQLDVTHAELVVRKIQERKQQLEFFRQNQRNLDKLNGVTSLSPELLTSYESDENFNFQGQHNSVKRRAEKDMSSNDGGDFTAKNSIDNENDTLDRLNILLKKYTKKVDLPPLAMKSEFEQADFLARLEINDNKSQPII